MLEKVLLMAASAALLVIAGPRPTAKAMTSIIPAIHQGSGDVVQVRKGGGRSVRSRSGRGGSVSRSHSSSRSVSRSDGGRPRYSSSEKGSRSGRENGIKSGFVRDNRARSASRDNRHFDDKKFDGRKFAEERKFFERHHRRRHEFFFTEPVFDRYDEQYGCEWLKRKAISTGSAYWWQRYDWCRKGDGR